MAVSDDGEPDSQLPQMTDAQAAVPRSRDPAQTGATKRQALRDQQRRLLDQERRLLDKGSHAVEWAKASTAGTFWSRLNAVDFLNSSLQFAALSVLCLFPFLIIFSAEGGGAERNTLVDRLGLDQKAAQDVNQLTSSGRHAVTALSIVGAAVVVLGGSASPPPCRSGTSASMTSRRRGSGPGSSRTGCCGWLACWAISPSKICPGRT